MFSLFTDYQRNKTPRLNYIGLNRIRGQLNENLRRTQEYWRTSGQVVHSTHVLARLVGSFSIDHSLDIERFRRQIEDITPMLCMSHGIVAPTNNTIGPSKGYFYGLDDAEYLVSVDLGISTRTITADWHNCEPLRVIRHTLTDLCMQVPTGRVKDATDGFAVILIDIPALAVMYRCWLAEQPTNNTKEAIPQFVAQYVLPSMLKSQTDVAVFNRMYALLEGWYISSLRRSGPLVTPLDYGAADLILEDLLRALKNHKESFKETLRNIPVPFSGNALKLFQLPYIPISRQCQWALEVAYIPVTGFCLRLDEINGSTANLGERNYLKRLTLQLQNEQLLSRVPYSRRKEVNLDYSVQVSSML